jgi:endonuclease/exonuclease/phosphatase family metal-dependent hydrolase
LTGCGGGLGTAMGTMGRGPTTAEAYMTREIETGKPDQLTVLTFNMQHRDNGDELSIMAQRLSEDLVETPDFILCQEVLFKNSRDWDDDNSASVLARDLGYHYRATKRSSDAEGLAILSRYPFEYYAERELESQTSRLLLGFNRVSVMGEFTVPELGLVRVVNVHFTNWNFEKRVRTNQLVETMEWMAARQKAVPADVIVFGGDFNADPDGDEIKLVTSGRLARQFNFKSFNTNAPTRGSKGNPNKRVDYIFVSAPDRGIRFTGKGETRLWKDGMAAGVGERKILLSDHVPVLHEYHVTPPLFASKKPAITGVRQAAH